MDNSFQLLTPRERDRCVSMWEESFLFQGFVVDGYVRIVLACFYMIAASKQKSALTRDEQLFQLLRQMMEKLDGISHKLEANAAPKELDLDNLPTKDISLYKPSFVRKLKQSLQELKDGKVTKVESLFVEPSIKNTSAVLAELRKTKKYKPAFLKSLAQGLKESAYFKTSV